jgi:hypothetical protein
MKRIFTAIIGCMVLISLCYLTPPKAIGGSIEYDVADSAKITRVNYYIEMWKGRNRLIFEIGVKNTSAVAHQYRLKIFLQEGPSAGALYPRKGNPPVIKPGDEYRLKLPFLYEELPAGFIIKVTELNL